ncbi:hypothetical protein ACI65C_004696 [Semiaphis heraclei]
MYNHTLPDKNSLQELYSLDRERELAHISLMNNFPDSFYDLEEEFAITHQTKFVKYSSFFDHFDLELLLKLMKVAICQGQLFTIFLICVQIKGLKFPKELVRWLLVVSKLNKYEEAKIFLQHMTNTIEITELIEERTFNMA